jgi:hypothetical protein
VQLAVIAVQYASQAAACSGSPLPLLALEPLPLPTAPLAPDVLPLAVPTVLPLPAPASAPFAWSPHAAAAKSTNASANLSAGVPRRQASSDPQSSEHALSTAQYRRNKGQTSQLSRRFWRLNLG